MKKHFLIGHLLVVSFTSLFVTLTSSAKAGGGTVFSDPQKAPRSILQPRYVVLSSAPTSVNLVAVRAMLEKSKIDEEKTKGRAGLHGTLSTMHLFPRVEIKSFSSFATAATVKVEYVFRKDSVEEKMVDTVKIHEEGMTQLIDFEGVRDEFGAFVVDSSESTYRNGNLGVMTTSMKLTSSAGEITAIKVRVYDSAVNLLYSGGWPKATEEVITVPDHLKPRVYTDKNGRTLKGVIVFIGKETTTLLVAGRRIEVARNTLSLDDQKHIQQIETEFK
jgi:hypothetical protein